MTSRINPKLEGDDFKHRLLSFLSLKLDEPDASLIDLKENKWLLFCENKKWFVKRYPNWQRFEKQFLLVEELLKHNVQFVLPFHEIHQQETLQFMGNPIGVMQWLEDSNAISYKKEQDRKSALFILKAFHELTSTFYQDPSFSNVRKNHWLDKWEYRLQLFHQNIPLLHSMIPSYYFWTYLQWGYYAMNQLTSHQNIEIQSQCFLHGDVAHHNFLKTKDQKTFLIDFDLLTKGDPIIDDLQFAYRILPYIDWSLEKLWLHSPLNHYKNNSIFLNALMYPTDIFREWNRFIRKDSTNKRKMFPFLYFLTVKQFTERMKFTHSLHEAIRNNQ